LLLGVASSPVYGWDMDGVRALIQRGGGVNDKVDRAAADVARVQSLVETFLERSGYELPAVKIIKARDRLAADERMLGDVLDTVEKLTARIIDAGLWIAGELISNPNSVSELTDLGGDLEDAAQKVDKAGGKAEKVLGFIAKLVPFLAMLA